MKILFMGTPDFSVPVLEALIEAVTPDTRAQLNAVLDALRADREKAWAMHADGTYDRLEDGPGTSSQEALYRYFSALKVSQTDPAPEKAPAESAESAPAHSRKGPVRGLFHRLFPEGRAQR